MFKPSLATLSIVISLIHFSTAAIPPACVLACVNKEDNPSDIGAVCRSENNQLCLASICGGSQRVATEYVKSVCQSGGHEVARAVDVSSSGAAASTGAAASATTGSHISASATRSTTGTGAAQQAGNYATNNLVIGGSLAMVLVSVVVLVL